MRNFWKRITGTFGFEVPWSLIIVCVLFLQERERPRRHGKYGPEFCWVLSGWTLKGGWPRVYVPPSRGHNGFVRICRIRLDLPMCICRLRCRSLAQLALARLGFLTRIVGHRDRTATLAFSLTHLYRFAILQPPIQF